RRCWRPRGTCARSGSSSANPLNAVVRSTCSCGASWGPSAAARNAMPARSRRRWRGGASRCPFEGCWTGAEAVARRLFHDLAAPGVHLDVGAALALVDVQSDLPGHGAAFALDVGLVDVLVGLGFLGGLHGVGQRDGGLLEEFEVGGLEVGLRALL